LRYQESKEQSAELLRRVLALMGQHDAAFNPVSFAVWYEFAAGMNAALTSAIALATQSTPRLTNAMILQLYQSHVSDGDASVMQRISGELQQMMAGIGDSVSRTGDQAELFGSQLQGLTQALTTNDSAIVASLISQALTGTTQMQSSAQALEQQVKKSQQEIKRLKGELIRARDEVVLDPLTRVLNRKGFDERLSEMLALPLTADSTNCLVMLDIDHFKKVNDSHGHVMGDRVIQALGEVLRSCVPDKQHAVARYGGEEFAILLPNCTLDSSFALAQTVLKKTRSMKIRDRRTQEVVLTVSISGGVTAMQAGDDAQSLIARADGALYQSKQNGRDRVTCA
jgi:diguanylate cyclase